VFLPRRLKVILLGQPTLEHKPSLRLENRSIPDAGGMGYHARPMKKLVLVAVLAAVAYAVYAFVISPPEKRACARAANLCGLGESEVQSCVDTLRSVEKSNPDSVAKITSCVADAKSCGEAMGCAASGALTIGTGFVKDFVNGLQKGSK
jgi:hypothetical protein